MFSQILLKELNDYMVIFESKNEEIDGINYKNLFNKSEENVTNAIRFKLNNKYVDYELVMQSNFFNKLSQYLTFIIFVIRMILVNTPI